MTEVKLNIYQKLQKCRVEIQNKKIKATGKNEYSNYEYLELSDFLPAVNEVAKNNNLCTLFQFGIEKATLTIIDTEDLNSKIEFSTPVAIAQLKGCNQMQNVGGTQTYARRYLYMSAFEISESDLLNKLEEDKEAVEGMQKIDSSKVQTLKNLIEKTGTKEVDFLKWRKVKSIEDITNIAFYECINMLDKKMKKIEDDLKGAI
ncbi:ERF family protein [Inconstantimicrobium mannanitabidum]|uniref:Essential recombination function protein n=1 Tax=Inconstantimicrobium mannanitabidum TaxID=1604901 RepID=A0ACB5R9B4_9CLOT|nr:ERF family protein [Clostridium sp. TW13]GKX65614.1 essential recombination function protein [Clostridium sp. TW13]